MPSTTPRRRTLSPAPLPLGEGKNKSPAEAGLLLSGCKSKELIPHLLAQMLPPFLRIQHSPAQVHAMMAVKNALDPRGILNPGKMFEVFEVWKYPRLEVKLPWDHK